MRDDDRISNLPDDLLHRILTHLPIVSQASTSLLSRRWRGLWSQNTVLRLSGESFSLCPRDVDHDLLNRLIYGFINRWQAPRLIELHVDLYLRYITDVAGLTTSWGDFAASRYVQHLSISYQEGYSYWKTAPSLPPIFLACSPSLVSLTLKNCTLPELPPEFRGFRSLKALHISDSHNSFTANGLSSLLSACPLLEFLKLEWCGVLGHRLAISSQSLKTLVILLLRKLKKLVIGAAPSLTTVSFWVTEETPTSVTFKEDVPRLLNFSLHICTLNDKTPIYWFPMVRRISHVRILSIDLCMLEVLIRGGTLVQPDVFRDLMELHLNVAFGLADHLLHALLDFLRPRPTIEKLCLKLGDGVRYRETSYSDEEDEYCGLMPHESMSRYECCESSNGRERFPEQLEPCKLPGLKIARLIGFMGTWNEMRLLGFLLRSAVHLESLRLFCSPFVPDNILEHLFDNWRKRSSSNAYIMVGICTPYLMEIIYSQPPTPLVQKITEKCQMGHICSLHSGDQGFNSSEDMKVYWIGMNNDTLSSG